MTSRACPTATYAYHYDKAGIALRFEGTINPRAAVPIVPLAFRSRGQDAKTVPTPTPTPTPTPSLSPTPVPLP